MFVLAFGSLLSSVALQSPMVTGSIVESAAEVIKNCSQESALLHCLKKGVLFGLDEVLRDNRTWHVNDYLVLEKNAAWHLNATPSKQSAHSIDVKSKVLDVIKSRSIKLEMSPLLEAEGRKKKYKGDKGGIVMMGGMAMMGLIVQMIFGKLLLLAGGAFILAKIALLYSVLTGLKKSGSSGGEHVIYADAGGNSGGHGSGWHRSLSHHPKFNPFSLQGTGNLLQEPN